MHADPRSAEQLYGVKPARYCSRCHYRNLRCLLQKVKATRKPDTFRRSLHVYCSYDFHFLPLLSGRLSFTSPRESNEGDHVHLRFSILTKELELWNIIICFFFQITLDESIMKCEIFYFGPLDLVRVDWTKMIVFYVRSMQFRKRIYLISSVTLLTLCWIILFPLKVKTSEYFFLFKQNYNYYRDIKSAISLIWQSENKN